MKLFKCQECGPPSRRGIPVAGQMVVIQAHVCFRCRETVLYGSHVVEPDGYVLAL